MPNEPPGGGQAPLDFPDFSKLRKSFSTWASSGGGGGQRRSGDGRILGIVAILLVLFGLGSQTFYTIQPDEIGITLRFGRYRGPDTDAEPGLGWKWPLVDRLEKVPIKRSLKQEFGFRTQSAGVRSEFIAIPEEATMLTGDENVAVVEWVVQYRIKDAYRYVFKVRNQTQTVRDLSEAVMRKVVGDRTVNEVVTIGRVDIESDVQAQLQILLDQYETGVKVDRVLLQSNNPPDAVRPAFNDVNQAEQDRANLINEAQAQYNQVIPRAEGEARQAIQQAEGYALDRVNRSQGDAARFEAVYAEYRKAPEVTRKRLYLETLGRVLPQVGRKVVVDESVQGLVPMFDFGSKAQAAAVGSQQSSERPR